MTCCNTFGEGSTIFWRLDIRQDGSDISSGQIQSMNLTLKDEYGNVVYDQPLTPSDVILSTPQPWPAGCLPKTNSTYNTMVMITAAMYGNVVSGIKLFEAELTWTDTGITPNTGVERESFSIAANLVEA